MDFKKLNVPTNTQTRDMGKLSADTGNVYETVMVIAKRSDQVNAAIKQELEHKLQEFSAFTDTVLEEVFENREQIEISRTYERLPKPTLIAVREYEEGLLKYYTSGKGATGMPALEDKTN